MDAIVYETNCGAPCSFGYEVWLAPKGGRNWYEVASLDGAVRNKDAWGVNLIWLDADNLSVEYLRADDSTLLRQTVEIEGDKIKVSLRGGVDDPRAPAGGMLYNLH
jgi:hypothetical protein